MQLHRNAEGVRGTIADDALNSAGSLNEVDLCACFLS